MNQKWQINQRFHDSNLTGTGLGPAKSLAATELPKDLRNRTALHTTTKHLVQLPAVREGPETAKPQILAGCLGNTIGTGGKSLFSGQASTILRVETSNLLEDCWKWADLVEKTTRFVQGSGKLVTLHAL
jgi:hypothetical protein